MSKNLSILFVSSEVYPFAKESGVGDVSYSLPLSLRDLGHDVRVMLPKYGTISERKNRIHEINRLRDMPIPIGDKEEPATVKSSSINNPRVKVQAYITTNQKYFDSKKGVYHDPKTWKAYSDNGERFIFFNRSVVETLLLLGWVPDIIHCNDWQTALIPAYFKIMHPDKFQNTKVVFTIHNFMHQGTFELKDFALSGFPKKNQANFRHKNQFNFMKGALLHADYITTVSPTYAKNIMKDAKLSNGLNATLKKRKNEFKGIMNGIDTWTWNPATDTYLKTKYEDDFDSYKQENKKELCSMFGFDYSPDIPLIGMITRIDTQKGVDLLIDAAKKLFDKNIQLALLGQGDTELKKQLTKISKKYPDKFKTKYTFDEELGHLMEAGSDMYLMPSQHEPCGLNILFSMSYGTPPIAHGIDGIKDSVNNFNPKTKEGNSFVFENYDVDSLMEAIERAIKTFEDKDLWQSIVDNGMKGDYSWGKSAEEYVSIYRQILEDK